MNTNLTCKTCKFWVKGEIDPNNLGAPRGGLCTESIHLVMQPARAPDGRIFPVPVTRYAETAEDFPACGRYAQSDVESSNPTHPPATSAAGAESSSPPVCAKE